MESRGCRTLVVSHISTFNIMSALLIVFLHFIAAATLESTSDKDSSIKYPHLTSCVSNNMETFYCRWDVGTMQSLSNSEAVRLFFMAKIRLQPSSNEWHECPHYPPEKLNECFFSENYTYIWSEYSIQLRSRDNTILYDEKTFNVEDIVEPDPPLDLNWTMLNASSTGSFYDILLSWLPPPSADVKMGWMTLEYEVQQRKADSEHWDTAELVKSTHRTLYGFQSNVNYEVRVRCKRHGGKKFGEFSDSLVVHVPLEASRFPVVALLIFGTLFLIAIMTLVILSQQEKLMVILLPPVPGPKIRGIEPELLMKGKVDELTSILGAPPELRPELYTNDPWVEFIDLDFEEQGDRIVNLDRDLLTDRSLLSNFAHLSIGFRDDDSGHASCCDPDLGSDADTSGTAAAAGLCSVTSITTAGNTPLEVPVREAMYTQVSEVKPYGKVLLSPEDEMEYNTAKDAKEIKTAENKKAKYDFQLVVSSDHRGYTSELNAGKNSPTREDVSSLTSSPEDYQKPYHESVTNPTSYITPSPVYTVVENVDRQNSLVLTPNSIPALVVLKALPTTDGYLTPDLLENITP
ncbi:growth hormone receptor b isoform X2 [Corythoichthys intestinalis]|uniref:growth hormone receptor b isoform X2 n=1 Tax=Corythoichthys intestinalis TaxID=161448 RepID=UPI0025A4F0CD|nr:growth hormone receptor b isoform X2 [Corythoichthys intestinalis]